MKFTDVSICRLEMAGTTASVALESAIFEGFLGHSTSIHLQPGQPQPLGLFYDLDVFEKGLKDVQSAFGEGIVLYFSWYIELNINDWYL